MSEDSDKSNKVTPGWNDPPMLSYSATQPPPKSRLGNKRVPFPLGPSSAAEKTVLPTTNATNNDSEEVVPNMKDITFSNLRSALDSNCNNEVCEKIELMIDMWTKGLFTTTLKNDLYRLSDCIARKECVTANKLNLEIHMKYPNHCKDWISAISFLIHNK